MSNSKSIQKIMNKILSSEKFMDYIYKNCQNVRQFNDYLGLVLKYYIVSKENKVLNFEDIRKKYYELGNDGTIKNQNKNETISQVFERNIIN